MKRTNEFSSNKLTASFDGRKRPEITYQPDGEPYDPKKDPGNYVRPDLIQHETPDERGKRRIDELGRTLIIDPFGAPRMPGKA
jgi:hypothetical protein